MVWPSQTNLVVQNCHGYYSAGIRLLSKIIVSSEGVWEHTMKIEEDAVKNESEIDYWIYV